MGLVAAGAGLLAEIPRYIGAVAGGVAALLICVILGLTIAAAPLAPGAQRPGLRDLLWAPLLAGLAFAAVCAAAGYFGLRSGLRLSRRTGSGPESRPTG